LEYTKDALGITIMHRVSQVRNIGTRIELNERKRNRGSITVCAGRGRSARVASMDSWAKPRMSKVRRDKKKK